MLSLFGDNKIKMTRKSGNMLLFDDNKVKMIRKPGKEQNSALRALSTLRGLRGAPEVPPLCRETQSLGQQMLK